MRCRDECTRGSVVTTYAPRTASGPKATIAEPQQQLDALVVKHAVLARALQELLRCMELPAARSLGRAVPARVAVLAQAVTDDDNAAAVDEAAKDEFHGLLHALWQR